MDLLIDRFEEMVTEIDAVRLVDRLRYALSAQFVDRLEESGKINSNDKLRMKDILKYEDDNPRETNEGEMDTMEKMKR